MTDYVRLRVRIEFEYDANPDDYPGCGTPEEMAAYDLESYLDDPVFLEEVLPEYDRVVTVTPC